MKTIKLPFGLNEHKKIVHVVEVERGKKCNCTCPGCRSALIACKGSPRQAHFKHAVVNECKGGLESAIHLAAKKLIREKKQITLPKYVLMVSARDSRGVEHAVERTTVVDGTIICFHSVEEEVVLEEGEIKADILAKRAKTPLIIEIFYRHKVDAQKIEKIRKADISAIEINLYDLKQADLRDWDAFWLFMNDPERIQWLYNAKGQNSYSELLKQLEEKILLYENKYRTEGIRQQREKEELLQAYDEIRVLSSKEGIAKLKQSAEMHYAWEKSNLHLQYTLHSLPYFLNKQIQDGDWIYGCDRRVWQTAFYWGFVYNKNKVFSIEEADGWLRETMRCKVPSCVGKLAILRKRCPQLSDTGQVGSFQTLRGYCYYLCKFKFLKYIAGEWGYPGRYFFRTSH